MQEMRKASTRQEILFPLAVIAHQMGHRPLLFIRDLFIQDRVFIIEQFNVSIPKKVIVLHAQAELSPGGLKCNTGSSSRDRGFMVIFLPCYLSCYPVELRNWGIREVYKAEKPIKRLFHEFSSWMVPESRPDCYRDELPSANRRI